MGTETAWAGSREGGEVGGGGAGYFASVKSQSTNVCRVGTALSIDPVRIW